MSAAAVVNAALEPSCEHVDSQTLSPGVIAETEAGIVYLMAPEGGIDAVELGSGELLWHTDFGAKPLHVCRDHLIAQAEVPQADVLAVVLLNRKDPSLRRLRVEMQLPAGVVGAIDDGPGRSFVVEALSRGTEIIVDWRFVRRAIDTAPPTGETPSVREQHGAFRVDFKAGKASPSAAPAKQAPAVPKPLQAVIADETYVEKPRLVDGVYAGVAKILRDGEPRLVLRRWDAETAQLLPEVQLGERAPLVQHLSTDGKHLVASTRLSPDPRVDQRFQWTIYSMRSGERIAEIGSYFSVTTFLVHGKFVLREVPSYSRAQGGEMLNEPTHLEALDRTTGKVVWRRAKRETRYDGPLPPRTGRRGD